MTMTVASTPTNIWQTNAVRRNPQSYAMIVVVSEHDAVDLLRAAQLAESRVMNSLHYQTVVASKAARVTLTLKGDTARSTPLLVPVMRAEIDART